MSSRILKLGTRQLQALAAVTQEQSSRYSPDSKMGVT